jgi:hypothetical protein
MFVWLLPEDDLGRSKHVWLLVDYVKVYILISVHLLLLSIKLTIY